MEILDDRFLDAARAYERLLGTHRLDLNTLREYQRIEDLINPPWQREMAKLLDSTGARYFRDLERDRLTGLAGLQQSVLDGYTGGALADALRAATGSTWEKYALAARRPYATLESVLGGRAELDEAVRRITAADHLTADMQAILASACRIREPWLDLQDPRRSFEALDLMHQLGQTLGAPNLFQDDARAHISSLLGDWAPEDPLQFAGLDLDTRRDALLDAGFDLRLTTLPQPAYPDAIWASSIGPRPRTPRHADSTLVIAVNLNAADYSSAIIRRVERALRRFVEAGLRAQYGDAWIHKKVPKDMRERWEANCAGRGHAGRPLSLRDSELGDLLQLIIRGDHWREVFEGRAATNKEEIRISMSRLIAVRRPAAHSDDLGPEELMICATEGRRLLHAFGLPIPWRVEPQIAVEVREPEADE